MQFLKKQSNSDEIFRVSWVTGNINPFLGLNNLQLLHILNLFSLGTGGFFVPPLDVIL
jgi:hypothetical protein